MWSGSARFCWLMWVWDVEWGSLMPFVDVGVGCGAGRLAAFGCCGVGCGVGSFDGFC